MNEEDKLLLAEFDFWLKREGIDLPPERRVSALADFADIRKHVAIVDGSCAADAEPSMVYVLRPVAASRA